MALGMVDVYYKDGRRPSISPPSSRCASAGLGRCKRHQSIFGPSTRTNHRFGRHWWCSFWRSLQVERPNLPHFFLRKKIWRKRKGLLLEFRTVPPWDTKLCSTSVLRDQVGRAQTHSFILTRKRRACRKAAEVGRGKCGRECSPSFSLESYHALCKSNTTR